MKARVSDLTAIFFAVFGFTCWVLGDSCIKWIGQYGLPPEEIVAFMGFFMAVTLALQAAVRRRLGNLRPRSVVRQVLRALLDMTNNVCVVIALRHLSLTMFYILVFTSPMVISLLSAVFLGECITRKKALALLVGFGGVIIAVDPLSHAQHIDLIGLASCLVCVACFSVNMVWSRVLTRTEPPESLAFCSGLVTAMAGLALTSFHPHPLTPTLWLALGMMGVFCAAGTLSFYFAVKHTSASNVSQFHYTQLLTGALISYIVWHDKPGLPMLVGGSLIIGSGLLIAFAPRDAQMALSPASPADKVNAPTHPACRPPLQALGSEFTRVKLPSKALQNSPNRAQPWMVIGNSAFRLRFPARVRDPWLPSHWAFKGSILGGADTCASPNLISRSIPPADSFFLFHGIKTVVF